MNQMIAPADDIEVTKLTNNSYVPKTAHPLPSPTITYVLQCLQKTSRMLNLHPKSEDYRAPVISVAGKKVCEVH